jgi:vacuolar-type H+-ATPase subunit H
MAVENNRLLTRDRNSGERPRGVSLGPVGQRFANFIRGTKDQELAFANPEPDGLIEREQWAAEEEVLPRFPLSRHGYHCAAVDAHVAELEQELAEVDRELAQLRARSTSRDDVSNEIKRIGEQTAAVLIAANEQRDEIVRTAQEEAGRLLSDARARATLITTEGEARLRALQAEHESAECERQRLLEDVRNISAALAALADSSPAQVPSPHGATEEL